jgi:hypothetical protein
MLHKVLGKKLCKMTGANSLGKNATYGKYWKNDAVTTVAAPGERKRGRICALGGEWEI